MGQLVSDDPLISPRAGHPIIAEGSTGLMLHGTAHGRYGLAVLLVHERVLAEQRRIILDHLRRPAKIELSGIQKV